MGGAEDQIVDTTEPDLAGSQLGDFRLLRRLGQGAMAEVYLAEQSSLKRQVAVKVLKTRLAADETYVRRFQREAQAAAALVHANIVQIHEVGHVARRHYIVQEYVQGLNLRQWLARHGPPDLRLALVIMRQVAAALAKAAEQGIVHRDIKPENIMLTGTGEVKVADFGLARLLREDERPDLTEVGITLGTPLYMSPEQVEGRPLDHRSDIYSFGTTCYQMLAGNPPFVGETALSVALQHLKKQPEPLENHRPDLPAPLCRAVHKMLAKSPEGRFQSAQELLRELRRIQLAHGGEDWPEDLPSFDLAAGPAGGSLSEATQRLEGLMRTSSLARLRRSHRVLWVVAGVGCFLIGAIVATRAPQTKPLLEEVELHPPVPVQESAFRQFLYASQVGTPEAWQSIIDNFGEKQYWANRAKQQLARIYLRERDLDRALVVFEDLASLDETEVELKAFGLAGKSAVLTMQGKYGDSAAAIGQLWPIRDKLHDHVMLQLLGYTLRKNRSEKGAGTSQEWQEWLDKLPSAG